MTIEKILQRINSIRYALEELFLDHEQMEHGDLVCLLNIWSDLDSLSDVLLSYARLCNSSSLNANENHVEIACK